MPHEQLERHGIDPADTKPIIEALGSGELDKAYELTTPEIAEKLSIAGTPEECVAKIKEIESAGVNHMILCITDPGDPEGVHGQGRRRPRRPGPAPAHRRRGDAGLRLGARKERQSPRSKVICFVSVSASMIQPASSRPAPEAFAPPNGAS